MKLIVLNTIFMSLFSKKDPEVLPKVIAHLNLMLEDENVGVVKRVILSMTQLYRVAVKVSMTQLYMVVVKVSMTQLYGVAIKVSMTQLYRVAVKVWSTDVSRCNLIS